jgi:hypothetical protein
MKKTLSILFIGVLVHIFIIGSNSLIYATPFSLEIVYESGWRADTDDYKQGYGSFEQWVSSGNYTAELKAYADSYIDYNGDRKEYTDIIDNDKYEPIEIRLRLNGDPGSGTYVNLWTKVMYLATADCGLGGTGWPNNGYASAVVTGILNYTAPESSEVNLLNYNKDHFVDQDDADINGQYFESDAKFTRIYMETNEELIIGSRLKVQANTFIGFGAGNSTAMINAWDNDYGLEIKATIPEPTTMLLIGSGLIGLAGFRRKFRKR